MNFIGSRFDYRIDRGSRMHSILSRQSAGFDLELLKSIGERQRKVEIVVWIVVHRPVEHERRSPSSSSRDGESLSAGLSLPGSAGGQSRLDHRPRKKDEVGCIAS